MRIPYRLFLIVALLFGTGTACAQPEAPHEGAEPAREVDQTRQVDRTRPAGRADMAEPAAPPASAQAAPHPAHARLQQALQQYQRIADQGGWPTIPGGGVVEPGDTSAQVPDLRRRLAATGDLSERLARAQDRVYDEALAAAVYAFQRRHGLATDSLLGPNTRAALNVPVADRIDQIQRNLARWRSLPDDLGRRYVMVNIPEFRLRMYRGGEQTGQMEVIVGEEYDGHATPVFEDRMEHLIFSPYWNIPTSIATEEIIPQARGNRDYLVENNFQIVSAYGPNAEVYDVHSASLDRVASGTYRLRQKPGPENALGLVKFMFPNQYAIYLHGTPADQLFDRVERDFSHGCIRVERPTDLAVFALSQQPDWTRDRIQQAMHNGEWQKVELNETIPVYILYFTTFVDAGGTVQFREDIYGHDTGPQEGFDL